MSVTLLSPYPMRLKRLLTQLINEKERESETDEAYICMRYNGASKAWSNGAGIAYSKSILPEYLTNIFG